MLGWLNPVSYAIDSTQEVFMGGVDAIDMDGAVLEI